VFWGSSPLAFAAVALLAPTGLQQGVSFTNYPSLAHSSELVRRLASPLAGAAMERLLAGRRLNETPLDLSRERYIVYVPAHEPPAGYGLLVFVPPWDEAHLPLGWASVLDRFGVVYVSAAGSGNSASTVGRREPLALIAEANAAQRYPIDPERIFVGGFSGGSRVALRLALGYPDVFRGVMLNAGSDPIGDPAAPLPPRDLFELFRTRTRLVYVTGDRDDAARPNDVDSQGSMKRWCVAHYTVEPMADVGHKAADPAGLAAALADLEKPVTTDAAKQAACQARVDRALGAALAEVKKLIASGKRDEARKRLIALDTRFGGLAAPASLGLAGNVGL
jgi:pimeloyl-ACP methyl ester carboxylesterase